MLSGARAVCVLGVHRSGTSAVTRALELGGVYLGEPEDLFAGPDNPEGHRERLDVMQLHDRLLAALGRRWSTERPLDPGWIADPAVAPFRAELFALVERAFAGRALWGFKDPRACQLLPLWRQVLDALGVRLEVVMPVRHPIDVSRSIEARNALGRGTGLAIWTNGVLSGLCAARGLRVARVSFDRFRAEPAEHLRRLAGLLELAAPGAAVESAVRAAVHPGPAGSEREAAPEALESLHRALATDWPALTSPALFSLAERRLDEFARRGV